MITRFGFKKLINTKIIIFIKYIKYYYLIIYFFVFQPGKPYKIISLFLPQKRCPTVPL